MVMFAANQPILQATAPDEMPRRNFLGVIAGAGAIPAPTPGPIRGAEHLDEYGEWYVRLVIYPAGCPRPDGVEVEEMDVSGWGVTIERTRMSVKLARLVEEEGFSDDPDDPGFDAPAYVLPSGRRDHDAPDESDD